MRVHTATRRQARLPTRRPAVEDLPATPASRARDRWHREPRAPVRGSTGAREPLRGSARRDRRARISQASGLKASTGRAGTLDMGATARRAAVVTLVSGSIVVAALALWKIKIVIALLFLGFIVSAAMRPGIDWLQLRARVPRGAGLLLHYLVLVGIVAVLLWLFVPRAIDQVQQALSVTSTAQIHQQAKHSTGIKHEILTGIDKRLRRLPSGAKIIHPALEVTKKAFEVLVGLFFVFAVAAYWIFERDRAIALVQSMAPRKQRRVTRDTWILIDQKLGAFVRGQLILIGFVAA